ncbi:hypothetical protein MHYP_G00209290 [Metynnis hypsauchen]
MKSNRSTDPGGRHIRAARGASQGANLRPLRVSISADGERRETARRASGGVQQSSRIASGQNDRKQADKQTKAERRETRRTGVTAEPAEDRRLFAPLYE